MRRGEKMATLVLKLEATACISYQQQSLWKWNACVSCFRQTLYLPSSSTFVGVLSNVGYKIKCIKVPFKSFLFQLHPSLLRCLIFNVSEFFVNRNKEIKNKIIKNINFIYETNGIMQVDEIKLIMWKYKIWCKVVFKIVIMYHIGDNCYCSKTLIVVSYPRTEPPTYWGWSWCACCACNAFCLRSSSLICSWMDLMADAFEFLPIDPTVPAWARPVVWATW